MRLDPAAWTLSLVGCFYDWLLTRDWKKVILGMLPALFLLAAVAIVVRGHTLNKDKLAGWYLELGDKEIAAWEKQWAPESSDQLVAIASEQESKRDGSSQVPTGDATNATSDENGTPTESPGAGADSGVSEPTQASAQESKARFISPFAMALFRRVLQLQAGDQRAQWIVGMIMAQRGSSTQAMERLRRIAPDDREGYHPAHAWMAEYYMRKGDSAESFPIILHHLTAAFKGSRVPIPVLLAGGQLLFKYGLFDQSVAALQRAAQADPQFALPLAKCARYASNLLSTNQVNAKGLTVGQLDIIASSAEQRAIAVFSERVKKNPKDSESRLLLAEALVNQRKLKEADALLIEGRQLHDTLQLRRGHSEVWRMKFVASRSVVGGKLYSEIESLENAFRIDPTNPHIAQEVALLARLGGERPAKELLDQLQEFLAQGKATATTHAWIAEHYLVRGEYKESIPHLEQLVNRMPDSADYLNNLAYVLTKVAPNRLAEALEFSRRASKLNPFRSDFHDTLGIVLTAMGKTTEAITAFEEAIRLEPDKADFHTRAAEAYTKLGEPSMANSHRKIAKKITDDAKKSSGTERATTPYAPEPNPNQLPEKKPE